jgi:hypothetical protein
VTSNLLIDLTNPTTSFFYLLSLTNLGGKMEPYVKRCAATKLTSAEKFMYICKNQLGNLE